MLKPDLFLLCIVFFLNTGCTPTRSELRDRAFEYFNTSHYEEALPLLEQLAAESTKDSEVAVKLAVCRVKVETDVSGAIEILTDCVLQDPNYAPAHYELGRIATEFSNPTDQKNLKQAVTFLRKSVELEPENFLYSEDLADLYLKMGDLDSALVWYAFSSEINPNPQYSNLRLTQTQALMQQRALLDSLIGIDTLIYSP